VLFHYPALLHLDGQTAALSASKTKPGILTCQPLFAILYSEADPDHIRAAAMPQRSFLPKQRRHARQKENPL